MSEATTQYDKEAKKYRLSIFSNLCAVAAIVVASFYNPSNPQAQQLFEQYKQAIDHRQKSELVEGETQHIFLKALYQNGKEAAKSRGMPGNILFPAPANGFSKICFKAAWDLRENRPSGKLNHTSWSDAYLVSAKIQLEANSKNNSSGLAIENSKELSCLSAPASAKLRGVNLELLPTTTKNPGAPELRVMAHPYNDAMKQAYDDQQSFELWRMAAIIISALCFSASGTIGAEARRKQKTLREENPGEFEAFDEAKEFAKGIRSAKAGKAQQHRI